MSEISKSSFGSPFEYRDAFFLSEEIKPYIKENATINAEIIFDAPFSPLCHINIIIDSIINIETEKVFIFQLLLKDYISVDKYANLKPGSCLMDMRGIIDEVSKKFTLELCDLIDLKNKNQLPGKLVLYFKDPWVIELTEKRKEKLNKLNS